MSGARGISIVIPVFNESGSIGDTVAAIRDVMKDSAMPWEIVVVDDGSEDGTRDIVAHVPGVKTARHETNRGYGASLKTGILLAGYDQICITDADATYPLDRIPDLVAGLQGCDLVIGRRRGGRSADAFHRRLGKRLIFSFAGILAGSRIPDLNSGMRAFRKADILPFFEILPRGFSFTSTSTLAFLLNGYRIRYVDIAYRPRLGKSKLKPVRDGLRITAQIVRVVLRYRPGRVYGLLIALIATACLALAIMLLAFTAFNRGGGPA